MTMACLSAAAAATAGLASSGLGGSSSSRRVGGSYSSKSLSSRATVNLSNNRAAAGGGTGGALSAQQQGRATALVVFAAKGRNARLAGRDRQATSRTDRVMREGEETAAEERTAPSSPAYEDAIAQREQGLKYNKRGKVSSQLGGQVSKAALKRIRDATTASKEVDVEAEARAADKRQQYRAAQGQGIPEIVTNRMLKRITIFSGVPLLLGFTTGPIFYGLKVFGHVDLAPWQFFVASTASFGGAFLGITYGVISASWEPRREGTFWGLTEVKANIPILMATVMGKASGEDGSGINDEEYEDDARQ